MKIEKIERKNLTVLNNKSNGRWCQPCSITIQLRDVDHANAIANVIHDALMEASKGGDFQLNGFYIGHDVRAGGVVVCINESTEVDH